MEAVVEVVRDGEAARWQAGVRECMARQVADWQHAGDPGAQAGVGVATSRAKRTKL